MAFTKKIAGWVAGRIKGEQARKDTMRWMEKTGLGQILDIAGDIALTQGAIKGVSGLKGLMTGQKAATAAQAGQAAQQTQAAIAAGPKPAASLITGSAPPVSTRAISQAAATPSPAGIGMGASRAAAPAAARAAAPVALAPTAAAPTAAAQAPMRAMVAPGAGARTMAPRVAGAITPPSVGMTPGIAQTAMPQQNILQKTLGAIQSGASATMRYGRENAPIIAATAPAVANVVGAKIEQDIEEDKIKREQDARNRLAQLLMPMFQAQMGQAAPSFQPRG